MEATENTVQLILEQNSETLPGFINDLAEQKSDEEFANTLESLPLDKRAEVWHAIPLERQTDVLVEMGEQARESIVEALTPTEKEALVDNIDAEELIELTEFLSDDLVDAAIKSLDEEQRQWYEESQLYTDNEIGRWADHSVLILTQKMTVEQALRQIRRSDYDYVDGVFVVDSVGSYVGFAPLRRLMNANAKDPIAKHYDESDIVILATDSINDAIEKVFASDRMSLAVITTRGKLIGRLDTGTAAEFLKEEYEARALQAAGLEEESDLFEPVAKSARTRAFWLGLNLLTTFITSWFIGMFEATLQQVVALAVLMPIVASMGGIAGSQTLTLIVRGLALKQINSANIRSLFTKEMKVGILNGILWAVVIFVITTFWFESFLLGLVILIAVVVNILCAAVCGIFIPVILDKFKIDPALSGSVVLTTFTDIIGFVVFLGLGSLILL